MGVAGPQTVCALTTLVPMTTDKTRIRIAVILRKRQYFFMIFLL
jgi:hypothetical protein